MASRWWIYQRERFPLAAHVPLIAAFSISAVSYSALLRGAAGIPGWGALLVAFPTAGLFFLQRPESSRSGLVEPLAALWVLLTYLGLGALPHLVLLR